MLSNGGEGAISARVIATDHLNNAHKNKAASSDTKTQRIVVRPKQLYKLNTTITVLQILTMLGQENKIVLEIHFSFRENLCFPDPMTLWLHACSYGMYHLTTIYCPIATLHI